MQMIPNVLLNVDSTMLTLTASGVSGSDDRVNKPDTGEENQIAIVKASPETANFIRIDG